MEQTLTKSILVYVEPETVQSAALHAAVDLVGRFGGSITLATAVEPWPPWMFSLGAGKDRAEAYHQSVDEALHKLASFYPEHASRMTTRLLRGRPHLETIREAIRDQCTLVMKDAEGSWPEDELVAGLDFRLLRKCPCPVWLVRPRPARRAIGVAIAPEEEQEGIDFNRRLLETAADLAEKTSQELHVIQAWELIGESHLIRHMSMTEYESYMEVYESKVSEELFRFLEPYGSGRESHAVHLVKGLPEAAIASTANELGLSTLVIGTVARAGLAGHLMGNTAERVIARVKCGVFALKPEGWRSPLEV